MSKNVYETHKLNEDYPYYLSKEQSFKSDTYCNWHHNIEILYCLDGVGKMMCNYVEYTVQKGDMIVVNSDEIHAVTDRTKMQDIELILLTDYINYHLRPKGVFYIKNFVRSKKASELFEKLVFAMRYKGEHRHIMRHAAILELVAYLAQNHSQAVNSQQMQTSADANVKKIIGYVTANYKYRFTLDDVAKTVGLSKYYMSREFKRAIGKTVVEFTNELRCKKAQRLLENSNIPIYDIAVQCGFESSSYFTRAYKSVMGCLPSTVRKK